MFKEEHIRVAWDVLSCKGWLAEWVNREA
jgi:hypothetical protein